MVSIFRIYISINKGLANCQALNGTLSEYGPLIQNGCALVGGSGLPTIGTATNVTATNVTATNGTATNGTATNGTSTNGTSTNGTAATASQQSVGFAVQASFLSMLAIAVLL